MPTREIPLPASALGPTRQGEQIHPLKIVLLQGNLITQNVDAIVNAANESLLGGGGIDGQVHRAAGSKLYEECKKLGGCETGNAKITNGYNLTAKYVIHAVGPIYPDDPQDVKGQKEAARLLESVYQNILRVAKENGLKSIAIPAISTGIFGYPTEDAAKIARDTVMADLQKMEKDLFKK